MADSRLSCFTDQGLKVRGVVHVGANDGAEVPWYLEHDCRPVLCFEPHPDAVARARERLNGSSDLAYIQCALGAREGTLELLVPADGDDEKTSHSRPIPTAGHEWTQVPTGHAISVSATRFDDWARRNGVDLSRFNALVIDAQGMELEVLEGFGAYLQYFDYLCVELSERPIYEGEPPAEQVLDWLEARGYRQETPIEEHGDVLFMKASLPFLIPR